jgi:hypothetical protein
MILSFTGSLKNKADEKYPGLRDKVDNALKEMGPDFVLGEYRQHWTKSAPESGYCHAVTEVLLRSDIVPEGSVAWRIPTKEGSHYCIKTPDGDILDFTDRQHFEEPLDYDKGQPKQLAETAERYDSFLNDKTIMRIPLLAEKLGIQLKPLPSLKKMIQENLDNFR